MPTPTKEDVAAQLSAITGKPVSPEDIKDEELANFSTPGNDEETNQAETVETKAVETKEQSTTESSTEDAAVSEKSVQEETNPEIKALQEQLMAMERRLEEKTQQAEKFEPEVPKDYQFYLDKEQYDPEKGIYGGLELNDEMTAREGIEWKENKDEYVTAMNKIEEDKELQRLQHQNIQLAREEFRKQHPDKDPLEIERDFKEKPLTYGQAVLLRDIEKAGGIDKYIEQKASTLSAKAQEDTLKIIAANAMKDRPLNNSDGTVQKPSKVELPKSMTDYYNSPPETRKALEAEVAKMFDTKTEFSSE